MRKLTSVLLVLALLMTGVVSALASGPVVIKFAAQGDSTPATQAAIDAYNAAQSAYKVEWTDMTNDSGAMREQLITSLKAGSADYDVLSLDVVWAGEFAAAGYIEPLDMMLDKAGLNPDDFNAGSMASGLYSGKQYVLPFFPDLGLLYFRKDIVSEEDAAKLTAGDYTWEDLKGMAEAYMGQAGTVEGFVFQSALYEGLVCNANEFTANWTNLKGGLEAMKSFIDSKATPDNIMTYTEGETANSFVKGESVFSRNWPYQWNEVKTNGTITIDQVGVAPLPGGSTVGGWLLAINKNSQNIEGAFDFIKFLNSPDGQLVLSQTYLPGNNAMLEDEAVIANNELLSMEGFTNAMKTTIARPVSAEYSKVSDAIQQAVHAYLNGTSAIEDAVAGVEAALAQ